LERAPLILGAAALILLLFAFYPTARRRRRARARRAVEGERDAERVLEDAGYRVLERQARRGFVLEVDGEPEQFELRADFVVRRGRRRFVADAKTGGRAPSLSTAATRRQLLEYRLAYDVDGVLLVDMRAGRVRRVGFPFRARRWPWVFLGVALGVAASQLYALAPW